MKNICQITDQQKYPVTRQAENNHRQRIPDFETILRTRRKRIQNKNTKIFQTKQSYDQ